MKTVYYSTLSIIGIGFAAFFFITIGPLIIDHPNIIDAFKAGYVNPYASGFSTDAIACWMVLAAWVVYEKAEKGIKHGWIALLLGLVPGVATGFAFYLIARSKQVEPEVGA